MWVNRKEWERVKLGVEAIEYLLKKADPDPDGDMDATGLRMDRGARHILNAMEVPIGESRGCFGHRRVATPAQIFEAMRLAGQLNLDWEPATSGKVVAK
jgi:hypothetical protein